VIADGTFGITKRPADGGRGLDGVIAKADGYYNPASEFLEDQVPGQAADAVVPGARLAAGTNGATP